MLIAIDPGTTAGAAVFSSGVLVACYALPWKQLGLRLSSIAAGRVVVEVPKHYPPPRGRAKPNDLITLAARAGYLAGACGGAVPEFFRPDEWKGQVSKDITTQRSIAVLDAAERDVVRGALEKIGPKTDDMMDAIALGLVVLGRVQFKRAQ